MVRVLLVEDDRAFRRTIRDMLIDEFPSLEVCEATTADEAIEEVRLQKPGLVFMDIRLSGRNGLDAMREIKDLYPDVPVAILTSYDFPEYREAAHKYGAEQFLVKGITKREHILSLVAAKLAAEDARPHGFRTTSQTRLDDCGDGQICNSGKEDNADLTMNGERNGADCAERSPTLSQVFLAEHECCPSPEANPRMLPDSLF